MTASAVLLAAVRSKELRQKMTLTENLERMYAPAPTPTPITVRKLTEGQNHC